MAGVSSCLNAWTARCMKLLVSSTGVACTTDWPKDVEDDANAVEGTTYWDGTEPGGGASTCLKAFAASCMNASPPLGDCLGRSASPAFGSDTDMVIGRDVEASLKHPCLNPLGCTNQRKAGNSQKLAVARPSLARGGVLPTTFPGKHCQSRSYRLMSSRILGSGPVLPTSSSESILNHMVSEPPVMNS